MLVALVGFGAVAVDFSYHHVVATELQTVADAAALSGARTLQASAAVDPSTAARNRAVETGLANAVQAGNGPITTGDVEIGCWNPATSVFLTPPAGACADRNAVRVTVQKTGQPLMGAVFQRVYNQPLPIVRKRAVAWIANVVGGSCIKPFALPYNALYTLAHGSPPAQATTPLTQQDLAQLNAKSASQRVIMVAGPQAGNVPGSIGNWEAFSLSGNAGKPFYMDQITSCDPTIFKVDGPDGKTLNGNQRTNWSTEAMTSGNDSYCSGNTNANAGCYTSTGVFGRETRVSWGVVTGGGSGGTEFMVFSRFTLYCYFTGHPSQSCTVDGVTYSGKPEGTIVGRIWEIAPGKVEPDDVLGNSKSTSQRLMLVQ